MKPSAPARNRVLLSVSPVRGGALAAFLRRTVLAHLRGLGLVGCEVSLSLVGDGAIRTLNRDWREKDRATDVLSFPAGEAPKGAPGLRPLGDLVVSLDTAERQARALGNPLRAELARYLAHGLLHLLGHDHHAPGPRRKMATLEARLLGKPGLIPVKASTGARAQVKRSRARVAPVRSGLAPRELGLR